MKPTEEINIDYYHFELPLTVAEKNTRIACEKRAQEREVKWSAWAAKGQLPASAVLKRAARKGIPPIYRPAAWMDISGASKKKRQFPDSYYSSMVMAGQQSPVLHQIELDLPRTFPKNKYIASSDGQRALKCVLMAYAAHNKQIGYCQSMNYLAALLLLGLDKNEENAFWLLTTLIDDILYSNTYSSQLTGCHVEMRSLGVLIEEKLPRLHKHLAKVGCETSMFATDWYLCLFATSMPSETAARIWDSLLYEGPKVLFRVALAVLKMHQTLVMKKDNPGEIMKVLKDATQRMHDREALMHTAFEEIGSLQMKHISDLRCTNQLSVESMLREREAARRRQDLKQAINAAQRKRDEQAQRQLEQGLPDEPDSSDEEGGSQQQKVMKAASAAAAVAASNIKHGASQVASVLSQAPTMFKGMSERLSTVMAGPQAAEGGAAGGAAREDGGKAS